MGFKKPVPEPLYVKVIYKDGSYDILKSPSTNVDLTLWIHRVLGYKKSMLIERIEKYNFD